MSEISQSCKGSYIAWILIGKISTYQRNIFGGFILIHFDKLRNAADGQKDTSSISNNFSCWISWHAISEKCFKDSLKLCLFLLWTQLMTLSGERWNRIKIKVMARSYTYCPFEAWKNIFKSVTSASYSITLSSRRARFYACKVLTTWSIKKIKTLRIFQNFIMWKWRP